MEYVYYEQNEYMIRIISIYQTPFPHYMPANRGLYNVGLYRTYLPTKI